jgi:RNA polymerase sigma-B factor
LGSDKVNNKKLSNEELLFKYFETKDISLRNLVLERFLYIAQIVAKKFIGRGVEYDDLFQVASLSLVNAIERFDVNKGIKFQSFATPTLIGEIKNYFRDKTRIVKITRKDSEDIKKMDVCKANLREKHGKNPKPIDIAKSMNVSVERVLELSEAKSAGYATSLESVISSSENLNLYALMGHKDVEFTRIEDREFLKYCFDKLTVLEKQLIKIRFIDQKSQTVAAKKLGISQMQVSRIERKVLIRLNELLDKYV